MIRLRQGFGGQVRPLVNRSPEGDEGGLVRRSPEGEGG
jgi:hypothetical protein